MEDTDSKLCFQKKKKPKEKRKRKVVLILIILLEKVQRSNHHLLLTYMIFNCPCESRPQLLNYSSFSFANLLIFHCPHCWQYKYQKRSVKLLQITRVSRHDGFIYTHRRVDQFIFLFTPFSKFLLFL